MGLVNCFAVITKWMYYTLGDYRVEVKSNTYQVSAGGFLGVDKPLHVILVSTDLLS